MSSKNAITCFGGCIFTSYSFSLKSVLYLEGICFQEKLYEKLEIDESINAQFSNFIVKGN